MSSGPVKAEQRLARGLGDAWSATDFVSAELTDYARDHMLGETRRGLVVLGLLSLIVNLCVLLFALVNGRGAPQFTTYVSTHGLLAALSMHVAVSARWVRQIRALNLLGVALLVVTGAALMLLAHRLGSLDAALMAGVALIFMTLPVIPWGLREASAVTVLVYLLLTASATSVEGRFDQETLWTLQFLVIASALTALILIARNVGVRKHDLRARFDLENARAEMERLSNIDPLTGAWNRRFLNTRFDTIAAASRAQGRTLELALLDIDHFKEHNDTYGHQVGDLILRTLSGVMRDYLPGDAYFIRLGGDEFAVLYDGGGLPRLLRRCLDHLVTDPKLLDALEGQPVGISTGFARCSAPDVADQQALYQRADRELYRAKERVHGGAQRGLSGATS